MDAPAPGERVSANFRMNDDMTWDGEVSRVAAPEPLEYGWTEGSACRRRAVEVYEDQVDRPEPPAVSSLAPGETLEASVSRTEDCLWNARFVRTAAPDADEMAWNEGSSCQSVESHRLVNQPSYEGLVPEPGPGERVSADVSRNADCTYDVSYTVRRAEPKDTGWITWDSETVTGRGTSKYHHGYRAFFNLDEVPRPDRGSNVSMSVRLNEFCKYDGEISYSDLYEWTGGGSEGGIRTRTTAVFAGVTRAVNPRKRTTYVDAVMWKIVETRIFLGSGNEGSEAEFELDGGVNVHGRTYRKESTLVVPVTVRGGLPGGDVDLSGVPEDTLDMIQRYVDKAGRIGLR